MNKKFATIVVIATLVMTAGSAQAEDQSGWFVNGGAGSAHYHATYQGYDVGSDTGTAYQFNFGYHVDYMGIEAGYTDLGSVSGNDGMGDSAKLSGDGWTLGLDTHLNPTDKWYISARGGLFLWKLHAKATYNNGLGTITSVSGSEQSGDWYAGVGTGIDFNQHWSAGVKFDYYKIKKSGVDIGTRMYTANVEYRF